MKRIASLIYLMRPDHNEICCLMQYNLDIEANRSAQKYPVRIQILRVLWGLCFPLFRFSPRIMWTWRNVILRAFGAQIGQNVHIHSTVEVAMPWNLQVADFTAIGAGVKIYNLGVLIVREAATISQGSHLCGGSHDYTQTTMPLLKCPITIGRGAWVCADAFVGPGVSVGDYAIIGARGVAVSDVPPYQIVAGNPARIIKTRIITGQSTQSSEQ